MKFRCLLALSLPLFIKAQSFTHADSLRGTLNGYRSWWNVLKYELFIQPNLQTRELTGHNKIIFQTTGPGRKMQIDLQAPMKIDSVIFKGKKIPVSSDGNAHLCDLNRTFSPGTKDSLLIHFSGKPRAARFAPWDGGLTWTRDDKGNDWVAVSCQGLGASVWWPNKDHLSDEPDQGMDLSFSIPDSLTCLSNGKLLGNFPEKEHTRIWRYRVTYPINNYDVTMNLGKYICVTDTFNGENGILDMEYCVLGHNEEKALSYLAPEAKRMLRCFEHWFGPYPFYRDGYRLTETPYLGMEHQSGIAYGNKFKPGYLGRDRSGSGVGLFWDFIIVHESGHEWFGNNISAADIADNWIHEGFTTYSEVLFIERYFNKDSASKYLRGLRTHIGNKKKVIGPYGVNEEGADNYEKGANLVHMIRLIIDNDSLFREILRGMNREFGKKTVSSGQIEQYIMNRSGKELKSMFDQYLRTTQVPELKYSQKDRKLRFQWTNCVKGFKMPLRIFVDGKAHWIEPETNLKEMNIGTDIKEIYPDPDFYIRHTISKD